jgi:D-beta-D-heptose 7-phosphate kinase/D-beta-D-heptose 1-phosphate adenosyltransferase
MSQAAVARETRKVQTRGRKVVFTNGCFDLLHVGHVRYLQAARRLGDALVVGVNSDASVRRIKGPERPINPERHRLEVLAALECVTWLCLFGEETPLRLIRKIGPDILVKGGDWPVEKVVGRDVVTGRGGRVLTIPLVRGVSTTEMIRKHGGSKAGE